MAHGTEVKETQVVLMTDEEARNLVLKHPVTVQPGIVIPQIEEGPTPEIEPTSVTLKRACDMGWLPMTYDAARQRKRRANDFPIGVLNSTGETVYTKDELEGWYRVNQK